MAYKSLSSHSTLMRDICVERLYTGEFVAAVSFSESLLSFVVAEQHAGMRMCVDEPKWENLDSSALILMCSPALDPFMTWVSRLRRPSARVPGWHMRIFESHQGYAMQASASLSSLFSGAKPFHTFAGAALFSHGEPRYLFCMQEHLLRQRRTICCVRDKR